MFWNRKKAPELSAPSGIGAADFAGTGTPLKFNSVDFRDGQQSLFATRLTTADMIPLLEQMDAVGYDSMEMWGGATFDVAVRFLKDDPWERVRTFQKYVKKTPLKMVLRGQNLVGYKAYPDDVVEAFIAQAAEAGSTYSLPSMPFRIAKLRNRIQGYQKSRQKDRRFRSV